MKMRTQTLYGPVLIAACLLNGCSMPSDDRLGSFAAVQLNDFTTSTQSSVSIDVDGSGRTYAAWDSRRQQGGQYGVYGRAVDVDGTRVTGEVQLNQFTTGSQMDPAVGSFPGGGAWIAWTSIGQDGEAGSIVARRFDANLRPVSNEVGINTIRQGHQHDPAVAVHGAGSALFVWTSADARSGESVIRARLVRPDGSDVRAPFTLSDGQGVNSLASVTATEGGFAIAWNALDDGSAAVRARTVHADGALGAAFDVSPRDGRDHIEPAIDADDNDRLIVAWLASSARGHDVNLRRFDATGLAIAPLTVFDCNGDWLGGVAVAAEPGGTSVVAFNRARAGTDDLEVEIHRVDANGRLMGPPRIIGGAGDQHTEFAKNARRMAALDGRVVIAWAGDAGLGDESAAVLSLSGLDRVPPPQPVLEDFALAVADADEPIPPVWDPDYQPLPPLLLPPGSNGFEGMTYTGWNPPDPEIGVGPAHFVQVTNVDMAFFDADGAMLFEGPLDGGSGFFAEVGGTGFLFDPEALYDPHTGRFFVMANERNAGSFYNFAVSDDSNPVGDWHKYRVDVSHVDNDIDSPNMAVDDEVLYMSADFFGPDKYQVLMVEKAPLLSGGGVNSRDIVITGAGNQSMGLPIIYDADAPAGYLIQSSEGTSNGVTFSEVRLHAIRDQLTNPTRVTVDVPVATYAYPVRPSSRGTSSRPAVFEPRFWSSMYVGGSLWAVHHIGPTRTRARWYEIEMNGWPESGDTPSVRQWGELDAGGDIHTFFPSIAADAEGNAAIVLARSSPNEYISMWGAFRRAGDPLGEFRPMELIRESTSAYHGSRWGDYSHIEPHPNEPGVFWGTHEWTTATNAWRTWIAPVDTRSTPADLVELTMLDGVIVSGGLAELEESDDQVLEIEARVTGEVAQPHLVRMMIVADSENVNPETMDLRVESRITGIQATTWVYLRNWNNDNMVQVARFGVNMTEDVFTKTIQNASRFVRNSDGRIEIEVKQIDFLPFTLGGFHSLIDHFELGVD